MEIKIFEGERELTKDNFLIGSFKLEGIEKELRGIPEIEVTFNVDANGIVNVFAQDVKNKDNKKSITVNSNTSRLTKEEISLMIEESIAYQEEDRLLKEKRELYYSIEDMCNNILVNLEEIKDKIPEKAVIIQEEVNSTLAKLREKTFDQHSKQDYIELYKTIKTKYSTLVLKVNKDDMNFADSTSNKLQGTSIYNDDDDNYNFCLVDEEENDENIEDAETKIAILEIKNQLIELCNDTLSILMNEETGLNFNDITYLREYVDDCMMWVYVTNGLTIEDYESKIIEFNETCNQIMSKYANEEKIDNEDIEDNLKENQKCYEFAVSLLDLLSNVSNTEIISNYDSHIEKLRDIVKDKEKSITEDINNYLDDLAEQIISVQLM